MSEEQLSGDIVYTGNSSLSPTTLNETTALIMDGHVGESHHSHSRQSDKFEVEKSARKRNRNSTESPKTYGVGLIIRRLKVFLLII